VFLLKITEIPPSGKRQHINGNKGSPCKGFPWIHSPC
jgi:hypothetical protein